MRVFVDSDVVVSSLISSTGAANFLINHIEIEPVISIHSITELQIVVQRIHVETGKIKLLIKNRFEVIEITKDVKVLKQSYEKFVTDKNDALIVTGAHSANVSYLISYNLKHFKIEAIKNKLDILVLTPALFLQFLRSQQ